MNWNIIALIALALIFIGCCFIYLSIPSKGPQQEGPPPILKDTL